MTSERLRRSDRLLVSRDFARVGRQGARQTSREFVMLVAPARIHEARRTSAPVRRIGITASRKVGNAVVRNRVKRGVREWFRRGRGALPADVDVVVIARRDAAGLSGAELEGRLDELARRVSGKHERG